MKHTPGPWTAKWNGVYGAQVFAGSQGIANIGGGKGVQMANAALIAAAPELLEACKLAVEYYEANKINGNGLKELRSAITRAERGQ